MNSFLLKEDYKILPLPVILSSKLKNRINAIKIYNQNNINGISQWNIYLKGIINYIEKRSIAFDYSNRSSLLPNKTRYNNDLNYGIGYQIMTDTNDCAFAFVFMMNLKPEEFGLKVPPTLKEDKQYNNPIRKVYHLNESDIRMIVRCIIQEIVVRKCLI